MERIKKENKEKIMEILEKAGDPNNYETSWDDSTGVVYKIKSKAEKEKGRKSRSKGLNFETKVRKDLENQGRIISKWNNNVDLEKNKITQAKRIFNPFKKIMVIGTGFPDFISIKLIHSDLYNVIGVEVKTNGILSKEEKQKCLWLLNNKIFGKIWIAKKSKKRGKIEYIDFAEKYNKI